MPIVASVDYPNKLIYLSAETVGVDLLPVEVYKEVRARRWLNEADRGFSPLISARGNEPVGPTNTAILTVMADGARIVPFDITHTLSVTGTLVSIDEGLAGSTLFDRSVLTPGVVVDISYQPPQVEVIEVPTGAAALTPAQEAKLNLIADILQADEEYTQTQAIKRHKDTKAILVQKDASSGPVTDVTLTEPL